MSNIVNKLVEVIFLGNGIVWHPIEHRVLCQFVNGEYRTKDIEEISLLTKLGYNKLDITINIEEKEIEVEKEVEVKETKTKKSKKVSS